MADEDGSNGLGFDDPSFGFIGGGPVSLDGISDAPIFGGDPSAGFVDSGVWQLDGSPQANSYDLGSNTTLSSAQPGYLSPSWPTPTFDPRQHQPQQPQQQPQPSQQPQQQPPPPPPPQQQQPDPNTFGLPNFDPTSVYFPGVAATKRGALPVSKPSLRSGTILSPAMQEQLRNIAMPPHLQYGSPKSASSPESAKAGAVSSPDASSGSQKDSRKRKISTDDLDDDDLLEEGGKPVKKTAHNMIEKRYRTNINDKIAALRDSVPSLRIMSKSARGEDTTEDREELHGLTPAHKLNKATVLSKATEYIRHLEKRNNRLIDENSAMHQRIAAFEKLFMAGAMNGSLNGSVPPMQQPTPTQYPQEGQTPQQQLSQMAPSPMENSQENGGMPTGLIEVPEDMKRILSAQMNNQPYPVPQQLFRPNPTVVGQQQIRPMQQQQQQQQQGQQGQQTGWSSASPYFGKLMVGSLAGLMILEAVREDESTSEEPQGRGLFALPLQLLRHIPSHLDVRFAGYDAISIKFMLLFGLVLWVFIPSLFSRMDQTPRKQQSAAVQSAPSLASPISVRRRAWETAIQTVWVPHHSFFLEAAALMLKTLKLSVRNVFGVHAYQLLTGLTPEQEVARVRAWATALDAQLTGGDAEICMSRLILTLLASGTVPDTPSGLMLKALHVRVLLWDLSQKWYQLGLVNYIATKVAERQWKAARDLNQRLTDSPQQDEMLEKKRAEYMLPDHLAVLVEQDCDKVLTPAVIQRAHNLAFNVETTHDAIPIDGMDSVVDDTSIGSPMDALAAWWSTAKVHDILTTTLYGDEAEPDEETMELAVKVAPLGSRAHARAVMARSVLAHQARGRNIAAAVQVLRIDTGGSSLIDPMSFARADSNPFADRATASPPPPNSPDPDLQLCLRSATAAAHIKRLGGSVASSKQYVRESIEKVIVLATRTRMSLLGFTAVMEVLEQILAHKETTNSFAPFVESLAAILRLWMGSPLALQCGVPPDLQDKMINKCLGITKRVVGMEVDTGYESMTDDEGFR